MQNLAQRKQSRRICARCGNTRFERMPRITFTQMHVMPFFGLYPWRCVTCSLQVPRTLRSNSEDRGDWG